MDIKPIVTPLIFLSRRRGTDSCVLFQVRLRDVEPAQADGGAAAVLYGSL
jgi:hypothetical protein